MPDLEFIRQYYDRNPQHEWERAERHRTEFAITWKVLETYLPPAPAQVLDCGGGPGRYAIQLARRGYAVTLFDLSSENLAYARQHAQAAGVALQAYDLGDATNLNHDAEGSFDAVLLMGPLYHLTRRENRLKALREAAGRLKPGGVLFSSMISRFGILGDLLRNGPQWIENREEVRSVIERGHDPEQTGKIGFHGYFGTADEIAPLHEKVGLETLVVAGVEPAISGHDEDYNSLEGTRRELWLDLLYELSREPSLVASSRHMLYVGRKPRDP
jgi:S-adenosylmethionine-dependent methyltransferase